MCDYLMTTLYTIGVHMLKEPVAQLTALVLVSRCKDQDRY